MAAGDLTTVDRVREHLRLEDVSDDALLTSLVTAASAWVTSQINRPVAAADYTDTFSGDGWSSDVMLRQYPVVSVASVTVDGVAVVGWALEDAASGVVTLPAGSTFTRGTRNVSIAYRAGWETVPADLEQAVVEYAAIRYRDRDWGGATSRSMSGDTVDRRGESFSGSWAFIRSVVDKYRRVRV